MPSTRGQGGQSRLRAWRVYFARALVVIGLARVLGVLAIPPLYSLGEQFAASPLPIVFGRFGSIDTFSRRFAVELAMTDGSRVVVPGGAAFKQKLNGPFTRVKLYADAVAFTDVVSERRRAAVLTHLFCRGGPLVRELEIPGDVARITVQLWSLDDPCRTIELACNE